MARIVNFTVITFGLLLLLNIAGIPTATGGFLSYLSSGNLTSITSSAYFLAIAGILASGAIGVIVGLISRQSSESFIVGGFAGTLFLLTCIDFSYIYNYFTGAVCPVASGCAWLGNILLLIILPYIAGYGISIIQWWRGNDI